MAVYWEDVSEGADIPELKKNCSTQQLVMYAGASLDFYQIHYDKDFALNNNLPGVIIHGVPIASQCAPMRSSSVATSTSMWPLSRAAAHAMAHTRDNMVCPAIGVSGLPGRRVDS